jgi:hypothetical protein
MKTLFKTIYAIFQSIGQARAAATLARARRYEEAKSLYTTK